MWTRFCSLLGLDHLILVVLAPPGSPDPGGFLTKFCQVLDTFSKVHLVPGSPLGSQFTKFLSTRPRVTPDH